MYSFDWTASRIVAAPESTARARTAAGLFEAADRSSPPAPRRSDRAIEPVPTDAPDVDPFGWWA